MPPKPFALIQPHIIIFPPPCFTARTMHSLCYSWTDLSWSHLCKKCQFRYVSFVILQNCLCDFVLWMVNMLEYSFSSSFCRLEVIWSDSIFVNQPTFFFKSNFLNTFCTCIITHSWVVQRLKVRRFNSL